MPSHGFTVFTVDVDDPDKVIAMIRARGMKVYMCECTCIHVHVDILYKFRCFSGVCEK